MPPRPRTEQRSVVPTDDDHTGDGDPTSSATDRAVRGRPGDRSVSRRRFLTGIAATASAGLAGCGARLPGEAAKVDAVLRRDGNALTWDYPASAVRQDGDDEGIGYAAIRFQALDPARTADRVTPVLTFRLNSTVADIAAGEAYQGYQADWFRFRIGVSRSYEGASGLRAFVQPNHWPELRTTYGYRDALRELVVTAPDVNEEGTIVVEGRFRPTGMTLPRRLHCGFEVQASQPGPVGRTVLADGRATFDVSTLDLPAGITLSG